MYLAFFKDQSAAFASGDAEVRFSGFSGAVDGAAHDGDADGFLEFLDFFFHFLGHADEVYLGAAAGGTGDEDGAVLR